VRALRSRGNTLKVLIDTSFLLPALGIDVEEEVKEAIKYFYDVEVYYTEVSVLEAMWKVMKIIPAEELNIVENGINAIRNTYMQIVPDGSSFFQAYLLYQKGHRDFIDDLLYAVSKQKGILFLTIDGEFINFLKLKEEDVSNVITPRKFVSMLEKSR
jgi:predicted nucleic acid-binding protein